MRLHHMGSAVGVVKWVVRRRLPAEPHSVDPNGVALGLMGCLSWLKRGRDCNRCSGVWTASPQVHRAEGLMPVLFRWPLSQQWPVLRRKVLDCSERTSWWVASWRGLYPAVLWARVDFHRCWISVWASWYDRFCEATHFCCQLICPFISSFMFSIPELIFFDYSHRLVSILLSEHNSTNSIVGQFWVLFSSQVWFGLCVWEQDNQRFPDHCWMNVTEPTLKMWPWNSSFDAPGSIGCGVGNISLNTIRLTACLKTI